MPNKDNKKSRMKTLKQMERHLKGISNHYRIGIILLIDSRHQITLEEIIECFNANEKTIGEHTRRLFHAGLVDKKHKGNFVEHTLSPYGKKVAIFLKSFQRL